MFKRMNVFGQEKLEIWLFLGAVYTLYIIKLQQSHPANTCKCTSI